MSRTKGDQAVSPTEQRHRIESACERDGFELVEVFEELDVSGGAALLKRPGLSTAVAMVEAGEVEVVMVAYFDRLARSLAVQSEVVSRIEQAGGRVKAVDVGNVSSASAAQWLSGTILGLMSEYYRRSASERIKSSQERRIAEGRITFPVVPAGYTKVGGKLQRGEDAPLITEAFTMRAEGKTIAEIRTYLTEHGLGLSYPAVHKILHSRLYLGELHFGEQVNREAHPPLVTHEVFERVQRTVVPKGRHAKSELLLARQRVLRCGSCGSALIADCSRPKYPRYRCNRTNDCDHHVSIQAYRVDREVERAVKMVLADTHGEASIEANRRDAENGLSKAQGALDTAISGFAATGLADETAAVERIRILKLARDDAQAMVDHLPPSRTLRVTATDWDRMLLDERRDLVLALIREITIASGRGEDRIAISLL